MKGEKVAAIEQTSEFILAPRAACRRELCEEKELHVSSTTLVLEHR